MLFPLEKNHELLDPVTYRLTWPQGHDPVFAFHWHQSGRMSYWHDEQEDFPLLWKSVALVNAFERSILSLKQMYPDESRAA